MLENSPETPGEGYMPSGKRCIVTIVVVLLSLPCLGKAASTLVEANEQTRQFVQQTMKEKRIPGLQVAVIKDERVVLSESYGLANVEDRVPVTNETLFPINSATKSLTGVAMMQLAEAGLLDLDAPVSRYLADLPKAWRGVRVRQLLAHTSGLPNIVDRQGLIGGGTELDAWKAVKGQPMVAPIGEQFAYNQVAMHTAGALEAPVFRVSVDPTEEILRLTSRRWNDARCDRLYPLWRRQTDLAAKRENLSLWLPCYGI